MPNDFHRKHETVSKCLNLWFCYHISLDLMKRVTMYPFSISSFLNHIETSGLSHTLCMWTHMTLYPLFALSCFLWTFHFVAIRLYNAPKWANSHCCENQDKNTTVLNTQLQNTTYCTILTRTNHKTNHNTMEVLV